MASPATAATKSPIGYDGGLTCTIDVTDIDRSIAWYQDVLGFKLLYKMDDMGWCELATEIPGVNVGLQRSESPSLMGSSTLTFGVKDIEVARSRVAAKGGRLEGPTEEVAGMVKLARFLDPDGNVLMFYQDLQKK